MGCTWGRKEKKNVDIELSYRCNCLDYNVIYQNSVPQWVQVDCHIIAIGNHLVNINLGIVVEKKDFFLNKKCSKRSQDRLSKSLRVYDVNNSLYSLLCHFSSFIFASHLFCIIILVFVYFSSLALMLHHTALQRKGKKHVIFYFSPHFLAHRLNSRGLCLKTVEKTGLEGLNTQHNEQHNTQGLFFYTALNPGLSSF